MASLITISFCGVARVLCFALLAQRGPDDFAVRSKLSRIYADLDSAFEQGTLLALKAFVPDCESTPELKRKPAEGLFPHLTGRRVCPFPKTPIQ
jgi:hypothetical protein